MEKFDKTKTDGAPRKLMNVELLKTLGLDHPVSLEKGLRLTYNWFLKQKIIRN